jgi:hypothetical protein
MLKPKLLSELEDIILNDEFGLVLLIFDPTTLPNLTH